MFRARAADTIWPGPGPPAWPRARRRGRGDEDVDESAAHGGDFLAGITAAWEDAARFVAFIKAKVKDLKEKEETQAMQIGKLAADEVKALLATIKK